MLIVQESDEPTVQVNRKQSHDLHLFMMGFNNIPGGLSLVGFLQHYLGFP